MLFVYLPLYRINTLVIDTVPVIVEHNNMYGHRLGLQDVMFVGMDSGEIFKLFANRTIAKHWGGVPPPPVYSEIIEVGVACRCVGVCVWGGVSHPGSFHY